MPILKRSVLSALGNVLFTLLTLGIGATIVALTVLPPLLKYQTYVVLSGSMEPAIHVGSVIVATAADPNALQVGDVITYVRPGDQENVTHRIVEIKGMASGRSFVTKGDANGANDLNEIRFDRLAGKVQLTIPGLGYFFKFIGSPQMRLLFIVVPGLLLLGTWLWEIWRPEAKPRPPVEQMSESMAPALMGREQPHASKQNIAIGVAPDAAAAVPLRR
ncbi:MAG TPA: signal peptidase I [Chloroflexota bacterium]|nr:signal peptidase I [Chloroflexota bacterium]